MSVELKIPKVGESITEVQVGDWLIGEGQSVDRDAPVVVIETDKATVELPAPVGGTVSKVLKKAGSMAKVGDVIGYMEEGDGAAPSRGNGRARVPREEKPEAPQTRRAAPAPREAARPRRAAPPPDEVPEPHAGPSARRALAEHGLAAEEVEGTGPGGRILKEDVIRAAEDRGARREPRGRADAGGTATAEQRREAPVEKPGLEERERAGVAKKALGERPRRAEAPGTEEAPSPEEAPLPEARSPAPGGRTEEVVPMTMIRRRIAERLVQAQAEAALLTTFNQVDMSAVIALRAEHKDAFLKRYGVKPGFMSFFVKASVDALKLVPQVNAEVRGREIVYKNYYDIGIAVGGGKGLVVPIIRDAQRLGFADIERTIADFARRAQENKLSLDELQGGTFTISNGGIYGSMLSTPIVNPPQSGILGLHAIEDRPVARAGEVVIRPMMYLALTYDHRLVDGREAVTFLKRIKETIEDPARMLLEI